MCWGGVGHWCSRQTLWRRIPHQPLRRKKAVLPGHNWSPRGVGRGNLGQRFPRVELPWETKDSGGLLQKLGAAGLSIPPCLPARRTLLFCHAVPRRGCTSFGGHSSSRRGGMLGSSSGTPEPPTGVCGGGAPPAGPAASFLPLSRAESLEHLHAAVSTFPQMHSCMSSEAEARLPLVRRPRLR